MNWLTNILRSDIYSAAHWFMFLVIDKQVLNILWADKERQREDWRWFGKSKSSNSGRGAVEKLHIIQGRNLHSQRGHIQKSLRFSSVKFCYQSTYKHCPSITLFLLLSNCNCDNPTRLIISTRLTWINVICTAQNPSPVIWIPFYPLFFFIFQYFMDSII